MCVLVSPEEYRSWILWETISGMFRIPYSPGSDEFPTFSCENGLGYTWSTILRLCSDKLQHFSGRLVCKLCRKPSSFQSCTVVDVPVLMQRRPGSPQISSLTSS